MMKYKLDTNKIRDYKGYMKAKKYINAEKYIKEKNNLKDLKGVVICKAKKCDKFLYSNSSTSNPEYCQDCG